MNRIYRKKALATALAAACALPMSLGAQTVTVNTATDDGSGTVPGTLSYALGRVNVGLAWEVALSVPEGTHFSALSALPTIANDMSFNGTGSVWFDRAIDASANVNYRGNGSLYFAAANLRSGLAVLGQAGPESATHVYLDAATTVTGGQPYDTTPWAVQVYFSSLDNAGTIRAVDSSAGAYGGFGVDLGYGTLTNTGSILGGVGGAGDATTSAGTGGSAVYANTGTLVNRGLVAGGAGGVGVAGSLSGDGGNAFRGTGTIENFQTLRGGAGRQASPRRAARKARLAPPLRAIRQASCSKTMAWSKAVRAASPHRPSSACLPPSSTMAPYGRWQAREEVPLPSH